MLEGSRVVMPRLADCSSGRTVADLSESRLAESACACDAAENANAPIKVAASDKHRQREERCFIRASLRGIPPAFKPMDTAGVARRTYSRMPEESRGTPTKSNPHHAPKASRC